MNTNLVTVGDPTGLPIIMGAHTEAFNLELTSEDEPCQGEEPDSREPDLNTPKRWGNNKAKPTKVHKRRRAELARKSRQRNRRK